MEGMKILKKAELSHPAMIAGWPGMGNVALGVVDYLRRGMKAVKFAEIQIDPMAALDSVMIDRGVAQFPKPPSYNFYYIRNPDMMIFEGEAQLPGRAGIELLEKVLDLAVDFKTRRIYTGAAFPMPISYAEEPELYGAVNIQSMKSEISRLGAKIMEDGHISGLNGLLLAFAAKRGVEAVCLLATMPQYAISLPNPKASRAIIEALASALNFKIDLGELREYIALTDEKMAAIEERVKDVLTEEDKAGEERHAEKSVPAYVMEKIEKLFREAKLDRSKALALKKELDRWDLYKSYEDRFLDLFKDNQ
jgi:proteasome assembly chaperone (PAC2) family protein